MKERLAGMGAVIAGVLASSCCILPAVLAALGAGSLGFGAKLAAYRPYFMALTFAFLAAAFYFTYRKRPPVSTAAGEAASDDCCAVPSRAGRTRKVTLWVVTAIALASAFYPQIQGLRHGGERQVNTALLASEVKDARRLVFKIEGMSCAECAPNIAKSLMKVDGVSKATVSYQGGKAVVEWKHKIPEQSALARAVESVEGRAVFDTGGR